jgi:hypothetical protein
MINDARLLGCIPSSHQERQRQTSLTASEAAGLKLPGSLPFFSFTSVVKVSTAEI